MSTQQNEVTVPAVTNQQQQGVVDPRVYDRIDKPMEAITKLGEWIWKSGMFGARQPEQGMLLAWTAIVKHKDPLDLSREFHIIEGRLSKRADSALAEFLSKGGPRRVFWLSDLMSREEAKFEITDRWGQKYTYAFTMKDAEEAGYTRGKDGVKDNWRKSGPDMLRARLIMKTMRIVEPEIVVGLYAPEELRDGDGRDTSEVPSTALFGSTPPDPVRKPVETTATVVEQPQPVAPPASAPAVAASTSPAPADTQPAAQEPVTTEYKRSAVLKEFEADSTAFDSYCVARQWVKDGEGAPALSDQCIGNIYDNLTMVRRSFGAWRRKNSSGAAPAQNGGAQ